VFGEFIPVSTNGGWTLLTGNNPEARGDYTPNTILAEGINHNPGDQVTMDRLARARAIKWIRANPIHFISLMPYKLYRLWAPDGEAEWFFQSGFTHYNDNVPLFRGIRALNQIYYALLILLALPSVWLLLKKRGDAFPQATAGLSICVYTPTLGESEKAPCESVPWRF
jgi:hypothetical protein